MASFTTALRYPFSQEGWFIRLFPLVLIQLIPIVGQMILVGYGMEVARTVYAGQTALPSLDWLKALRDGGLFVLTGLLYFVPLAAVIPAILSVGTHQGNPSGSAAGIIRLVITIGITLIISALVGRFRTQNKWMKNIIAGAIGIVPLIVVITLLTSMESIQFSPGTTIQFNTVGIILSAILGCLVLLIFMGLHVSGARYAIENQGLFDIPGTVKLLRKQPKLTGFLIINSIVMIIFAMVMVALGTVLVIIPGLFALVIWVIELWYLLADFLSSELFPNKS